MNKGIKKKLLLLTITVIMTMAVGGCGGSDSNETTTQSVGEETSTQSGELTREELLFGDVWLCGEKINFPCKVKDLPEGIELGKGLVISSESRGYMAGIELLYNGEIVGKTNIYGVDKEPGGYYDFSIGYEDYNVNVVINRNEKLIVSGLTNKSSREDIIDKLGEPDMTNKLTNKMYYWMDERQESYIIFDLDANQVDGTEIMLVYWEE